MDTQKIRDRWRSTLEHYASKYVLRRGIQFQVDAAEVRKVLAEDCPPQLNRIRRKLAIGAPSCVLLRPQLLQLLIDYERPRATPSNLPADVSGRGAKDVDRQADPGPTGPGVDVDADRPGS